MAALLEPSLLCAAVRQEWSVTSHPCKAPPRATLPDRERGPNCLRSHRGAANLGSPLASRSHPAACTPSLALLPEQIAAPSRHPRAQRRPVLGQPRRQACAPKAARLPPQTGAEHAAPRPLWAGHLGWPGAWPGSAGDRSTASGSWVSLSATWLHPESQREGLALLGRDLCVTTGRGGRGRAGGQNARGQYLVGVEGLEAGVGGAVEGAADAEPVVQDLQLCTEKPAGGEEERETVRRSPAAATDNSKSTSGRACATHQAPQPRAGHQAPLSPGSRGRPQGPWGSVVHPPPAPRQLVCLWPGHAAVTRAHRDRPET